jgi:multidrug efflux system membrane fusion protein
VSSENQIDSTTGTIKLKAIFKNENLILFPNQFVNIKVLIDFFEDAIVIPTSAIQRDKKGDFVYLIKNNKVKINYISTSIEHENETIGVSGIKKNDSVVSEGTNGLFDGAEVAL